MLGSCDAHPLRRVEISGRNRGIKRIDLKRVVPSSADSLLLHRITHFDLSHNNLEVLGDLEALTGLRVLDVSYNSIVKVVNLPPTLTKLNISHNKLIDLTGISNLTHLKECLVNDNRLSSFSGLHPKMVLESITASNNRIQSTLGLEHISTLRVLSLPNNRIAELDELRFLSTCPSLRTLDLTKNPVEAQKNYRMTVCQYQKALEVLDAVPLRQRHLGSVDAAEENAATRFPTKAPALVGTPLPVLDPPPPKQLKFDDIQTHPLETPRANGMEDFSPTQFTPIGISKESVSHAETCYTDGENGVSETEVSPQVKSFTSLHASTFSRSASPSLAVPVRSFSAFAAPNRSYAEDYMNARRHPKEKVENEKDGASRAACANEARLAMHNITAELHDALVENEHLKKENQNLRSQLLKIQESLKENHRLLATQLRDLSRTRIERDSLRESEKNSRERADRLKRQLTAIELRHRTEMKEKQDQWERTKVGLETQLADLQSQIAKNLKQARRCRSIPPPTPHSSTEEISLEFNMETRSPSISVEIEDCCELSDDNENTPIASSGTVGMGKSQVSTHHLFFCDNLKDVSEELGENLMPPGNNVQETSFTGCAPCYQGLNIAGKVAATLSRRAGDPEAALGVDLSLHADGL